MAWIGSARQNDEILALTEADQRHLCELGWKTSAVLLPPDCYLNHSCDPNGKIRCVSV